MSHALSLMLWIAIAPIGGTAAILGSLMTLGALLLGWVPETRPLWSSRLKLLGFSVAIALFGILLLWAVPFPATTPGAIAVVARF